MASRFATLTALTALGVGLAVGWVGAQVNELTRIEPPVIVAGEDLGLRIEWMNRNVPTGTLVVRLRGQWVEAQIGPPRQLVLPAPPLPPPRP